MNEAEDSMPESAKDVFRQATRLHRRRQFEQAAALYDSLIEQESQSPLADRARKRLRLVAKKKRPSGYAGFVALSGCLWAPALVFLCMKLLPGGGGGYVLLIFAVVPVMALWSLFQPGGWNRAAGYLTIVLLVAATAIPQNGDYTGRARVSEGLGLGAAAKMAVAEYYGQYGSLPDSNEQAALAPPDEFADSTVDSVTISERGVITINYKAAPVAGQTVILRPRIDIDGIIWTCTGGSVKPKYRPTFCR